MRIGHGYDVHRLTEGRDLILGGVRVPHSLGLDGHSDADVLTHAVMDALLGAAALGDIGRHFPDTDPQYKGISSLKLLAAVRELIYGKGYRISNIDVTVLAQKPKLAPYIAQMEQNLSQVLGLEPGRINVKATTEEHLGFTGREEGIACHAVCLLEEASLRVVPLRG
ncbi:MAG: 2-C-methyl-D-erythritol 2,4-cyclodiphosphate synthase [Oscillospiraceae bacterium]|nr:2-C-methyl-D-erythritol 2,4-cyclodiphosphate synthase [Oscillospiraceae bacterium]